MPTASTTASAVNSPPGKTKPPLAKPRRAPYWEPTIQEEAQADRRYWDDDWDYEPSDTDD